MEKWLPGYKPKENHKTTKTFNQKTGLYEIDIKKELEEIKSQGYIQTLRSGPTGIGYTLETLLGLRETNKRGKADFSYQGKPTELKSQRNPTASMLTLFTKEPHKNGINDKQMIKTYGYWDEENKREALYATLTPDRFVPQGLKIEIDEKEDKIKIVDTEGNVPWYWNYSDLELKIGRIVFVFANKTGSDKREKFHYNEAYLFDDLNEDKFYDLFNQKHLIIDLRMHIKPVKKTARNHGTGFRIRNLRDTLFPCYDYMEQLI